MLPAQRGCRGDPVSGRRACQRKSRHHSGPGPRSSSSWRKRMRAVVWTKYGPPDGLQLREVAKPAPKDNEVLIRIRATTVTTGDCEVRGQKVPRALGLLFRMYVGMRKPKRITIL